MAQQAINKSIQARLSKILLATQTINYTATSQAFTMRAIDDAIWQMQKAKDAGDTTKDYAFAIKAQQEGMDRHNKALDTLMNAVIKANEDWQNYINGCDGVSDSDMHLPNPVMQALYDEVDLDN